MAPTDARLWHDAIDNDFVVPDGSIHSPANKEECFNLHHASAQNVLECIFGVLKHRFRILILPPAYSVEVQAKIPAAHGNSNEDIGGNDDRSDARREKIAEDMWRDYQEILAERGMVDNTDEDSQEESFNSDEWDEEDEGL